MNEYKEIKKEFKRNFKYIELFFGKRTGVLDTIWSFIEPRLRDEYFRGRKGITFCKKCGKVYLDGELYLKKDEIVYRENEIIFECSCRNIVRIAQK